MPADLPGGDWEGCIDEMLSQGYDQDAAERICGALEEERKAEHGNVAELKDALEQGAGLIADIGVDLVSGVDEPAVDSKWVMLKSTDDGHDWKVSAPILLGKASDTSKRISYAPAMIPREPDKEGDVVATPTVEKAAHNFLTKGGGVDTDHSLIDGEGDVVESWTLKEERTFSLPGGDGDETYPAGTWMTGIKWGADAWDRIQAGELTGLSIYGMADHVALQRSTSKSDDTDDGTSNINESEEPTTQERSMTDDDSNSLDKRVGEIEDAISDMTETVESIKDAVESSGTDKAGDLIRDFAAEYAEKEDVQMTAADIQDAVREALADDKEDDEEDDEDEEEEMESSAEETESAEETGKEDEDANLEKGTDTRETASKAHETDTGEGGMPSYKAAALEAENQ